MRILLIMNGLVREQIDGGCVRIIEIAKQWQRAGHDIHLMGSAQAGNTCEQWGLTTTRHMTRWRVGEGRWWIVLHSIAVCLFFPRSLWRLRPDLIVTAHDQPYDVLPGVMLKLQRWRRVRLGVVVHLVPVWRFWRRQGPRWYQALAFLLAHRFSLFFAAFFASCTLAVSRATAHQLRRNRYPMRRVAAVACGVDLAGLRAVAPSRGQPRYDVTSVGRTAASKGVFGLLEAWVIVVAQRPRARLAMMGDGPDQDLVRERVRHYGLEQNVDLPGSVTNEEKDQCISASRVFVLPSHEENWSIAIGEAMALGTPVVAYDLPELLEVWGDAYHAVSEGDIPALAGAILSLLDDTPRCHELAKRGLARVSELDWSLVAERELQLLMGDIADGESPGEDPWLTASPKSRASAGPPPTQPPTMADR
ncbi:MAG: glycosyltransferase [Chloroflexi bacterium]|nr:glycosyltransferase [Chloroflexota bacterium]